jgi:hypothetical protein
MSCQLGQHRILVNYQQLIPEELQNTWRSINNHTKVNRLL